MCRVEKPKPARLDELQGILRQELEPGQNIRAEWLGDHLEVDFLTPTHRLRSRSPELHGALLALNEKLGDTVMPSVLSVFVLVEGFCLGTAMSWWDHVGSLPVAQLQSVWLYLALNVVGLLSIVILDDFRERCVYKRHKELIDEGIDRAGLNRYELISLVAGDDELEYAADQLKKDPSLQG